MLNITHFIFYRLNIKAPKACEGKESALICTKGDVYDRAARTTGGHNLSSNLLVQQIDIYTKKRKETKWKDVGISEKLSC